MHDWVMSFDLNSLYPHIIMQYNMSPDTILPTMVEDVATEDLVQGKDYKRPEGTCMAGNGQLFSTTKQGIIPQLIKKLYTERTSFKDAMLYYKNEADNLGQDTEFILSLIHI